MDNSISELRERVANLKSRIEDLDAGTEALDEGSVWLWSELLTTHERQAFKDAAHGKLFENSQALIDGALDRLPQSVGGVKLYGKEFIRKDPAGIVQRWKEGLRPHELQALRDVSQGRRTRESVVILNRVFAELIESLPEGRHQIKYGDTLFNLYHHAGKGPLWTIA